MSPFEPELSERKSRERRRHRRNIDKWRVASLINLVSGKQHSRNFATMKLFLLFPLTAAAFAPSKQRHVAFTRLSTVKTSRPDATEAIKVALEASMKFGATSAEARVAWDTVEEIDSSDNRYVGSTEGRYWRC
jgi:hypothetical protein